MANIGTLKELGVCVGDVVECISSSYVNIVTKGYIAIINEFGMIDSQCGNWIGSNGIICDKLDEATFYIISRSSKTPKMWKDMTADEKGALLLAAHEGKPVESSANGTGWALDFKVGYGSSLYFRIKSEPKVENASLNGGFIENQFVFMGDEIIDPTHRITFNLIDGKPDCASIKMEEV